MVKLVVRLIWEGGRRDIGGCPVRKLLLIALAAVLAMPAQAAITIYTAAQKTDFLAATQVIQNSWPDYGMPMVVNTPVALGLATISASQAALYDDDYYGGTVYLGTSGPPDPANPEYQSVPGTLTISSPESFLAVDLGSFFGTSNYYYSINNEQSGYITLAPGQSTFIGITGDGPITFSLIEMANDEVDVLHSYTSGTSDIPEPASWVMMIGGFGLVGAALRRRTAALGRLA